MPQNPYPRSPQQRPSPRPELDERRFRAAGLATSIVAALIAIVGVIAARGVFKIPLLGSPDAGV
jgi:hypothetical protein